LLVEDREDDVLLVQRTFQGAQISNPLYIVRNGEEAIAYLKGDGPYSNRSEHPFPDLVLLDLKMPRIDGFETLEWIRQQPGIRKLPVIVLASSKELRDVNKAYTLGANSFLVKPLNFQNAVTLAKTLHDFWLSASNLPEMMCSESMPSALDPRRSKLAAVRI